MDVDEDEDDGSYTPPPVPSKRPVEEKRSIYDKCNKIAKYEPIPYDPENAKMDLTQSKITPSNINEFLEKLSSTSNPVEMTTSVLSAVAGSDNQELKKQVLNHFTEKVEDQRRQLEKKREIDETIYNNPSSTNVAGVSDAISSTSLLPPNPVSLDNVFNNIKNIQIPDNLKDILKTVQEKSVQIDPQQTRVHTGPIGSDSVQSNCMLKLFLYKK